MKLTIKDHDSEKFIPKMPEGAQVVGLITRPGSGGTGALVFHESWEFAMISNGREFVLDQKAVYTAIIKAILNDFCDETADLAIMAGVSIHTVYSWRSGRRVPAFGTIKMLLMAYNVIKQQ